MYIECSDTHISKQIGRFLNVSSMVSGDMYVYIKNCSISFFVTDHISTYCHYLILDKSYFSCFDINKCVCFVLSTSFKINKRLIKSFTIRDECIEIGTETIYMVRSNNNMLHMITDNKNMYSKQLFECEFLKCDFVSMVNSICLHDGIINVNIKHPDLVFTSRSYYGDSKYTYTFKKNIVKINNNFDYIAKQFKSIILHSEKSVYIKFQIMSDGLVRVDYDSIVIYIAPYICTE